MGNDNEKTGTIVMKSTAPTPSVAGQLTEAVIVMIHPPGPNLGRRYPLTRSEHVIGRLEELDIPVDADSVSRRHARICRGDDGWFVEDLNSTNGSFVNDEKVDRRLLCDGDMLRFGEAILKYLAGSNIEAQYHEEIYRMTILDGLTGVHNKRFFLEFLEREIARATRHGSPLALVLFDVDHFKMVNDTYGHLAGDAVLKEICRRLKPRIRREDLLARYGGEEFACVLPDSTARGAITFAESLRQMVEREAFEHDAKQMRVTISLGVALLLPGMKFEATELIRRADEKLYAAKNAGRNRVAAI